MDHIGEWSKRNNLALNWSKSAEIVFSDSRKKRSEEPPPPLPRIIIIIIIISNYIKVRPKASRAGFV